MTGHEQDKSPELRVHALADGRVALTLPGQSPVVVGREEGDDARTVSDSELVAMSGVEWIPATGRLAVHVPGIGSVIAEPGEFRDAYVAALRESIGDPDAARRGGTR